MHGHRHIDWIGHIAGLRIISAPSPVMEVTDDMDTAFYIHSLAIDAEVSSGCLSPSASSSPANPSSERLGKP